ncbi:MAG TPA: sigma-70 family RNA polymerase sigma factor [Acidimicrobiales bacterium]|nr:sigma-70 family RNA polymerase sigma factor [Acidimicrobiales bacterium]
MVNGGYDDFFRQVLPRAVAVARRVTGERASAEDAAVEALARAHLHWKRVGALPWRDAWVLRVATHEALRHLPKPAALPALTTVDDEADAVALRQALVAALRRLPTRQREAVALRYLADLSERDVGLALGIGQGTVKTHLHRGLAALRVLMGHDFKEEDLGHIGL